MQIQSTTHRARGLAYTKYFFKKYLNQELTIFHQTLEVLFVMYIKKAFQIETLN